MNDATALLTQRPQPDELTGTLQSKLGNPESSSNFDLHGGVNQVLKDVGMSTADSGGKLTFCGQDPIIGSPLRFGSMGRSVWLRGVLHLARSTRRRIASERLI